VTVQCHPTKNGKLRWAKVMVVSDIVKGPGIDEDGGLSLAGPDPGVILNGGRLASSVGKE